MAGLTITTVTANKTYLIDGVSTGKPMFASSVDATTIRLTGKNDGQAYNVETASGFTDFLIDAVNPSDVNDAVNKINAIINFSSAGGAAPTTPGGVLNSVQTNSPLGTFGGDSTLVYDPATRELGISLDGFINPLGKISFGPDPGFNIFGGGLIENDGNNLFVGGRSVGVKTGLLINKHTAGVENRVVQPTHDGLIDFGQSGARFKTGYFNSVDSGGITASEQLIAGLPGIDPSAIASFNSTTKGSLIPRMTTAERLAIPAPAQSLSVFDTDTQTFQYNDTPLQTSGTLTAGKQYHIYNYNPGDDFTVSGASANVTGEVFTANATPPVWANGSSLGIPSENWKGLSSTDTVNNYTKQQYFGEQILTDAANIAWNLDDAQTAVVTPTGTRIVDNPTNLVAGGTYYLRVIGPGDLTFGSAYKWSGGTAPTFTGGVGSVDILTFICDGTNMYGVSQLNFS